MKFKNYENKTIGKYQSLPYEMISGDFFEALYSSSYPRNVAKNGFDFRKNQHAIDKINKWKQALKTKGGGKSSILKFVPNKRGGKSVASSSSSYGSTSSIVKNIITKDKHDDLQKALKMNIRVIGGGGIDGEKKTSYKKAVVSIMKNGGYRGLIMQSTGGFSSKNTMPWDEKPLDEKPIELKPIHYNKDVITKNKIPGKAVNHSSLEPQETIYEFITYETYGIRIASGDSNKKKFINIDTSKLKEKTDIVKNKITIPRKFNTKIKIGLINKKTVEVITAEELTKKVLVDNVDDNNIYTLFYILGLERLLTLEKRLLTPTLMSSKKGGSGSENANVELPVYVSIDDIPGMIHNLDHNYVNRPRRLVYFKMFELEGNMERIAIKISAPGGEHSYIHEANVYKHFITLSKQIKETNTNNLQGTTENYINFLKDNIVNMYGSGVFSLDGANGIPNVMTINMNNMRLNEPSKIVNIELNPSVFTEDIRNHRFRHHTGPYFGFVTEVLEGFDDLADVLHINPIINKNYVDIVLQTLLTANVYYGFYHGDFHTENVKINVTTNTVKLFDFDCSGFVLHPHIIAYQPNAYVDSPSSVNTIGNVFQ